MEGDFRYPGTTPKKKTMELLDKKKVLIIVNRALNLIDPRLMDHGLHVALVLRNMLIAEGRVEEQDMKNLEIMALLHDIGAYKTEEIDQLLSFETSKAWEHSIYGYLFLKSYFPYHDGARVVLYHHAKYGDHWTEDAEILHYAQLLHVADRACVWHDTVRCTKSELKKHLEQRIGCEFSPEAVGLFWKADQMFDLWNKLDSESDLTSRLCEVAVTHQEAEMYIHILVDAIDFRSRTTVLHTRGVMEIAGRLAQMCGFSAELQDKIYYGALLHDIGKIGTPISILEKPGKLTEDEWVIMRAHITLGEQILDGCIDEDIEQIAMRHHEKLNGKGYPHGLCADQITMPQRLLAVADVTSALCMSRSYKEAYDKERCLGILNDMAQKEELDAGMVALLEKNFDSIVSAAAESLIPVTKNYDSLQEQYLKLTKYFYEQPSCGQQ